MYKKLTTQEKLNIKNAVKTVKKITSGKIVTYFLFC